MRAKQRQSFFLEVDEDTGNAIQVGTAHEQTFDEDFKGPMKPEVPLGRLGFLLDESDLDGHPPSELLKYKKPVVRNSKLIGWEPREVMDVSWSVRPTDTMNIGVARIINGPKNSLVRVGFSRPVAVRPADGVLTLNAQGEAELKVKVLGSDSLQLTIETVNGDRPATLYRDTVPIDTSKNF